MLRRKLIAVAAVLLIISLICLALVKFLPGNTDLIKGNIANLANLTKKKSEAPKAQPKLSPEEIAKEKARLEKKIAEEAIANKKAQEKNTNNKKAVGKNNKHKVAHAPVNKAPLNGKHLIKFPNGVIEIVEYYKDGKLHGVRKVYNLSDKKISGHVLRANQHWKDGELHGLTEKYDENGNLIRSVNYNEGAFVGEVN